jgi:AcrR family transcriptional regulator
MAMSTNAGEQPAASQRRMPEGRQRIFAVARDLFLEYGYTGVSMSQIATQAGMTTAALYYHFKDKNDLFVHVLSAELDQAREALERLAALPGPTAEILEHVARLIVSTHQGDMGRLFDDLGHYVPPETWGHLAIRHPFEALLPVFERAVAAGELRSLDPWEMLRLFHALVIGRVKFGSFGLDAGQHRDDAELTSQLVDIFLNGVAGVNQPQSRRA